MKNQTGCLVFHFLSVFNFYHGNFVNLGLLENLRHNLSDASGMIAVKIDLNLRYSNVSTGVGTVIWMEAYRKHQIQSLCYADISGK